MGLPARHACLTNTSGNLRYRGLDGMRRWVGLGVIAGNLITMGTALARAHECMSRACCPGGATHRVKIALKRPPEIRFKLRSGSYATIWVPYFAPESS